MPGSEGYYIDRKTGKREDLEMLHNQEALAYEVSDEIALMMIDEMRKDNWPEKLIQQTYPQVYKPLTRKQRLSKVLKK